MIDRVFSQDAVIRIRARMKRVIVDMPLPPLVFLEKVCWGLRFRKWLGEQAAGAVPYLRNRSDLYAYLNGSVLQGAAINYLEFGVAGGDSIRQWMCLNADRGSRFFGFDTFQGLPDHWKHFGGVTPKGAFGTGGRPPVVEDEARVTWLVGLFQEALPAFLRDFRSEGQIVIHLDADLYSSTVYVLSALNDIMRPGAIVVFDEFASFDNEFRALQDFSTAFRRVYRVLACAGRYYDHVAIQFGA